VCVCVCVVMCVVCVYVCGVCVWLCVCVWCVCECVVVCVCVCVYVVCVYVCVVCVCVCVCGVCVCVCVCIRIVYNETLHCNKSVLSFFGRFRITFLSYISSAYLILFHLTCCGESCINAFSVLFLPILRPILFALKTLLHLGKKEIQ